MIDPLKNIVSSLLFLSILSAYPVSAQKASRKDLVTVKPKIDTTNYQRVIFWPSSSTSPRNTLTQKYRKPKKYIYNMHERSLKRYPYGKLLPTQVTLKRSLPGQKSDDLGMGLKRTPASLPAPVVIPQQAKD